MLDQITDSKILPLEELSTTLTPHKNKKKKIVFSNGCFDLVHTGHTRYLRAARQLGDMLVVAVNSDESIKRLKGDKRPLIPLSERMEILAGFYFIDYVTWFSADTPYEVIKFLKPDILVKGGDWDINQIVGKDIVEDNGGEVKTIPEIPGASTTSIVELVISRYS